MERYSPLQKIIKGRILLGEPLDRHTSFGIGGPAAAMAFPADDEDLRAILGFAHEEDVPILVLGNGTNVLIDDAGFSGVVMRLTDGFREIQRRDLEVTFGAGLHLKETVGFCLGQSLAGMEFCAGIPGTVGGAIWGNAGAQGRNMGQIVRCVEGIDRNGTSVKLDRSSIPFSYRSSGLPRDLILTRIHLGLAEGDRKAIEQRVRENLSTRWARHPLSEPSAGCIFKNPKGESAGKLIDAAGCKGMQVGGAHVSTQHANFIVNKGGATSADVLSLIDLIRERVLKRWGIILELEIKVIGEG